MTTNAISLNDAHRLCYGLKANFWLGQKGITIKARIEEREERVAVIDGEGRASRRTVKTGRIVFFGGTQGEHSLELSCSSEERILAHWQGYIENNGFKVEVGTKVDFPSASNWKAGGRRTGRVIKVGPKRVEVAYKFKHGGETTKSVRIADLLTVYVAG